MVKNKNYYTLINKFKKYNKYGYCTRCQTIVNPPNPGYKSKLCKRNSDCYYLIFEQKTEKI